MSNVSFYKWRIKYGGMDVAMLSEMKALAEENKRLKRMYAESQMQNELLKEAVVKPSQCRIMAQLAVQDKSVSIVLACTTFGISETLLSLSANAQRLKREKPEPLAVPERPNDTWAMDFMADQLSNGRSFRTFNGGITPAMKLKEAFKLKSSTASSC